MTEPTPLERIHAGYPADPNRRVRRRVAASYQHDPHMEGLAGWRTSDPARFAALPSAVRLALAHYESAKQAAEQTP